MRLNVRDLVQQTIFLEGVWDPSLTKFIEDNLRPSDVFIDVGAHCVSGPPEQCCRSNRIPLP